MTDDIHAPDSLRSAIDVVDDELPDVLCRDSPAALSDAVRDVLTRVGSPLFGGVTLTVADALGGPNASERALPAAIALEAVRLQGVVHAGRLPLSSPRKHPDTRSVLAGDFLYASGVETVLSVDVECAQRQRVLETLVTAARETSEGYARRDQYERRDNLSASSYLSVVDWTTGEIGAAAGRLGALVVDADQPLVQDAAAYGRALGVAVGVYDDVSAVLPGPSPLVCTDAEAPVQTLATIHARDNGVPVDRLQLFDHNIDRLTAELTQAGSIAYTAEELHEQAHTARAALSAFPDSAATDNLRALADLPADRLA